jgi:hypothetical protein
MVHSPAERVTLKDDPATLCVAGSKIRTLMAYLFSEKIVWVMESCSPTRAKDRSEVLVSFCQLNKRDSRRRASQAVTAAARLPHPRKR